MVRFINVIMIFNVMRKMICYTCHIRAAQLSADTISFRVILYTDCAAAEWTDTVVHFRRTGPRQEHYRSSEDGDGDSAVGATAAGARRHRLPGAGGQDASREIPPTAIPVDQLHQAELFLLGTRDAHGHEIRNGRRRRILRANQEQLASQQQFLQHQSVRGTNCVHLQPVAVERNVQSLEQAVAQTALGQDQGRRLSTDGFSVILIADTFGDDVLRRVLKTA